MKTIFRLIRFSLFLSLIAISNKLAANDAKSEYTPTLSETKAATETVGETEAPQLGLSTLNLVAHKAEYQATIKKGLSIKGRAIRELKFVPQKINEQTQQGLKPESWLYSFNVDSSIADIKEYSKLSWSEKQLKPQHYFYHLSGFFIRDKKQDIKFANESQKAHGKYNKKKWTIDLEVPVLDRLSYQLQLAYDVAAGKKDMHYNVVHKGRIEESHFKVLRQETISTVLGEQLATVVTKVRAPHKKRETNIWLSHENPLLLLKMTQKEKDGEFYEINLSKLIQYDKPEQNDN